MLLVCHLEPGAGQRVVEQQLGQLGLAETRAVAPPQVSRSESFGVTFPLPPVEGGTLTLTGTARDGAGNQALSSAVTITVRDVVAPAVTSVSPMDGAQGVDTSAEVDFILMITQQLVLDSIQYRTLKPSRQERKDLMSCIII